MHIQKNRDCSVAYRHPSDVDLWSGGVSERPLPGSMVGPTFACIIATQFSYSRRGDRFWYELGNQPSSFTPGKLNVRPILNLFHFTALKTLALCLNHKLLTSSP
jgi:hypothetical protein